MSGRFARFSKAVNSPSMSIAAILIGIALGLARLPFVQQLKPIGDFYVALLQMCVLPFLLATIPLAVRSALTGGTGGRVMRRLAFWLLATLVAATTTALVVSAVVLGSIPLDQATTNRIGALFGAAADRVDIEVALGPQAATTPGAARETGLPIAIPTNVFAALSANDTLGVIIFAGIFGAGMVVSERRSGASLFGALKHVQNVCILIFEWFALLTPIGIVALIAPQVALLGRDVYIVLAPFAYAFITASVLLILFPLLVISFVLGLAPRTVLAKMLKPLALVLATRNALVCVPAALEALKDELHATPEPCDLYIPIGFVVMRFGPMVHFVTAAMFIAYLMGRPLGGFDLVLVAMLSVMASFATIGVSGLNALAPMAVVLRPFGLSYELALPLMAIVDPIVAMFRALLNVALNSHIPVLAARREEASAAPVRAEVLPS
jgi:Na+/H+-dicarboxylate symporter